jgi:hypothetical protein
MNTYARGFWYGLLLAAWLLGSCAGDAPELGGPPAEGEVGRSPEQVVAEFYRWWVEPTNHETRPEKVRAAGSYLTQGYM